MMMDEIVFQDKYDFVSSTSPLDIQDDCGRTPVHEAVHAGEDTIIQDLSSFTVRDFDGKTVLHETAAKNALSFSMYPVLDVPIPPNTIDKNGRTPLHTAVLQLVWNQTGFISKKCRDGGSLPRTDGIIDARDKFGKTALMYAATTNSTELISDLLEEGAQVNLQDFEGRTALHEVCKHIGKQNYQLEKKRQNETNECFEILLNARGNPWITDLNGKTALDTSIGQINAKHVNRAVVTFPHPHNLQKGLSCAESFHDLVFKSTKGALVYAHQIIMQIRAGNFWNYLLQNGAQTMEPIQLPWSEWVLKKFLEYCYTDTITVDVKEASTETLIDLRNLASQFSISRLVAICGYLIATHNDMPFDEYLAATNPSTFSSDLKKVMDIIPTLNQGLIQLLPEDGKPIPIPKLFLLGRSEYFSRMFQSGMLESVATDIKISMPVKIVELMKEYFIMGTLTNLAQYDGTTLGALLEVSSLYQLDYLQNQIELFLCNQLEGNIETLIILSQQYNLPLLTSTIQQFKNIEEIHSEIKSSKKRVRESINTEEEWSTDPNIFAINPLPMSRFIQEVMQEIFGYYRTFSPGALYEIHKAAESFVVEVFEKALDEAKKNFREEVVPSDLRIAAQRVKEILKQ